MAKGKAKGPGVNFFCQFTFRNGLLWIALALFALAGVGFVLLSTRFGAFLSDDSYYYIEPARAALQGNGFNPSPFFAPLLPAVLVLLGWLGIEPLMAIRYLGAFLFGLNILLTGIIAKQAGISDFFAGLVALLVLLSDVLLQMHGWAMSEALDQTFILAAAILLFLYLKRPTYLRLALAASAAGLACLTRLRRPAGCPGAGDRTAPLRYRPAIPAPGLAGLHLYCHQPGPPGYLPGAEYPGQRPGHPLRTL